MDRTQGGYTLVELLVAIAIIGLIVAIAAPVAAKTIDIVRLRSDERIVVTELRHCQSIAVQQRRTVTLSTPEELQNSVDFRTWGLSADTELRIEKPVSWFSDGTTTGGRLVLHLGNRSRTVVIAWLTGTISVE